MERVPATEYGILTMYLLPSKVVGVTVITWLCNIILP